MDPEQTVRLSLRVLAADPSSIPDDVVKLLVDLARERKDDPDVARAFLRSRPFDVAARAATLRPSRRALDNVTCPVLLLHGRRDRLVPVAFAEAELERHPSWRGRFFGISVTSRTWKSPGRWLAEVADWFADTFD